MTELKLGERMKSYEGVEMKRFNPGEIVIIRIDGRCFHNFTRTMDKPFDSRLGYVFDSVLRDLAIETNCVIGYTQSDEISLVLHADYPSQIYFDGRKEKIISVLASVTTNSFMHHFEIYFKHSPLNKDDIKIGIQFDCRAFTVPSKIEAVNYLIWRELDAKRNAIQMIAHCNFSHKQLHKKKTSEILQMLKDSGINYDGYNNRDKLGMYITPDYITEYAVPKKRYVFNTGRMLIDCANRVEYVFDNAVYQEKQK